jgi:hypothetical protein
MLHAADMAKGAQRGSHAICQGAKRPILQAAWRQLDPLLQAVDKADFIIL